MLKRMKSNHRRPKPEPVKPLDILVRLNWDEGDDLALK